MTNNQENDEGSRSLIKLFKDVAKFLNPRVYVKLSEEEKEKRIRQAIQILFKDFNDPVSLSNVVESNTSLVGWIIAKFLLYKPLQSKIAIKFIENWSPIWVDVLSEPQRIVEYLSQKPEMSKVINDPRTIDWINRNTYELREFLWAYWKNPPDKKIDPKYYEEAMKIYDRLKGIEK